MPKQESEGKKEVVNEFCEDTSTVGAIFWWKSRPSYLWFGLWTIALIAAWGISIVQVVIVFVKYFQYNTTVAVKVQHATNVTFPAVTICNANPIRLSYFKEYKDYFPTLNEIMERMDKAKGGAGVNASEQEDVIGELAEIPSDNVNNMVKYIMYNLTVDVGTAGHQLEEMLVECNFQGTLCNSSDFSQWQDPNYGNCYTLSFPTDTFSSFIGPRFGLKLILYTQIKQYIPLATSDVGFRVQLHPIEYVPFPSDQGFSIAPGFVTSVAIKELKMERQSLPYDGTNCGQELNPHNLFRYWSKITSEKTGKPANYSATACVKHCYLEAVRKKCHCYDPSIITYNSAEIYAKDVGFDVPDACNITMLNPCMNKVAGEINKRDCMVSCNQPCHEVAFLPRVTNSLWPNKDYFQAMINVWKSRVPGMQIDTPDDRLLALAKLEVYFEDLNYQSITESPAMDVWALLTDIGGIFGLYTGVCFLTFLEYIQLCYRLFKGPK